MTTIKVQAGHLLDWARDPSVPCGILGDVSDHHRTVRGTVICVARGEWHSWYYLHTSGNVKRIAMPANTSLEAAVASMEGHIQAFLGPGGPRPKARSEPESDYVEAAIRAFLDE